MVRASAVLVLLALLTAGSAAAAGPTASADRGERFAAIDRLVEESMQAHGVPGVSIAIVDDFKVVYARGYGFAEPGRPVETDTLFQAASLSKPVVAVVAAAASEEGLIDLDADVAGMLTSWRLPPTSLGGPITLRMLLGHRAGINVPGFPGYELDEPLPDLPRILDGVPDKNEPIRVVSEPGSQWTYSGGGYVLAQLAIEDHTGRALEELAGALVFEPLGLDQSTYRILGASDRSRLAVGYREDGTEVAGGGWHAYPEQAAASLWTTPTEYAAIVIDVMRSYTEGTGVVLDRATARRLLDRDLATGFGVTGEGMMGAIAIGHAGANEGYRCEFAAVPDIGSGVVVMTNSDAGGADWDKVSGGVSSLSSSVIDAVAQELAWPRTSWWVPIVAVALAAIVAVAVLATLLGWLVLRRRRRRRTRSPRPS